MLKFQGIVVFAIIKDLNLPSFGLQLDKGAPFLAKIGSFYLLEIFMSAHVPEQPANSFRIVLELNRAESRMDTVLLAALREQKENINLKNISRTAFKDLFLGGKVLIKGQKAKTSSSLAKGITYVDILGY
jgi:hypothetical protein